MSRHRGPRQTVARAHPAAETKRARERLLLDVANGLELSSKMMHLADGPWKGSGQSGRLPIQHILRECAQRIVTEADRCREELENGGRVNFGEVVLEQETGPGEPEAPTAHRIQDLIHPWSTPRPSGAGPAEYEHRAALLRKEVPKDWLHPETSEAGPRTETVSAPMLVASESTTPKTLARLWAALLSLPALAGIRWDMVRSKQEGG